jgi:hypothetical protein
MCGSHSPLSRAVYEISEGGSVSPAFVCRYGPCPFHEHVNLEGYSEPV